MIDERAAAMDAIAARRTGEEGVGETRRSTVDEPDDAGRRLDAADQLLAQTRHFAGGSHNSPRVHEDLREKIRSGVEALYEGNAEKAVTTLLEVARPDVTSLAAQVVNEIDMQAGLKRFAAAYPEIARETTLATVADRFLEEALAGGKSAATAFDEAGEKTREYLRNAARESGIQVESSHRNAARAAEFGSESSGIIADMARARPGAARSA